MLKIPCGDVELERSFPRHRYPFFLLLPCFCKVMFPLYYNFVNIYMYCLEIMSPIGK